MSDIVYKSIRQALPITGKKVIDVTCDDKEEATANYPDPVGRITNVYIHFDDGSTFTFGTTEQRGFNYDGYPDDEPRKGHAE